MLLYIPTVFDINTVEAYPRELYDVTFSHQIFMVEEQFS